MLFRISNLAERWKDGGLKDLRAGEIFARDWPLVFTSRPTSALPKRATGPLTETDWSCERAWSWLVQP